MVPFRWPVAEHDIALAKEVVAGKPDCPPRLGDCGKDIRHLIFY